MGKFGLEIKPAACTGKKLGEAWERDYMIVLNCNSIVASFPGFPLRTSGARIKCWERDYMIVIALLLNSIRYKLSPNMETMQVTATCWPLESVKSVSGMIVPVLCVHILE